MTWLVNGLKDSLVYFGVKDPATGVIAYNKISDHNRSPLGINLEEIANSQRTANGTMRKNIIAQKHSFDLSWNDFPNMSTYTVDGGWGASQIYDFYLDTTQPFYIKITQKIDSDAVTAYQEYLVNFASCSFDIVKRNPSATTPYLRMNMNLSLEEV
jgi:hypothetical protein